MAQTSYLVAFRFDASVGQNRLETLKQKISGVGYTVSYPNADALRTRSEFDQAEKEYKSFLKMDNPDISIVLTMGMKKAIISLGLDMITLSTDKDDGGLLQFTSNLASDIMSILAADSPSVIDFKPIIRSSPWSLFGLTTLAYVLAGLGSFVKDWYGSNNALIYVIITIIVVQLVVFVAQRKR